MPINYFIANENDYADLTTLRIEFLDENLEKLSAPIREKLQAELPEYFSRHLNIDFFACLAKADNQLAAMAVLLIQEKPASPLFLTGRIGTIMNVYTRQAYRRQGIAMELMTRLIAIGKTQNLSYIDLMATKSGKPLYEKLGFVESESHDTAMTLRWQK